MRPRIVTWLGVALSVGILGYMAVQFDLENTVEALRVANLTWLLPAAVLYLALFPLRGMRWRWLMRGVAEVPVRTATEVFMVGAMANNILPARLGDVARALVLSRQVGIPATTTFSNVMLERILDGLTVVGLLASVLVVAPPGAEWVRSVGAPAGRVRMEDADEERGGLLG